MFLQNFRRTQKAMEGNENRTAIYKHVKTTKSAMGAEPAQKRVFEDLQNQTNVERQQCELKRLKTEKPTFVTRKEITVSKKDITLIPNNGKSGNTPAKPKRRVQQIKICEPVLDIPLPKPVEAKTDVTLDLAHLSLSFDDVTSSSKVPEGITDVDKDSDYFRCPLYAKDIVEYLQGWEDIYALPADLLANNKTITQHMLTVLVDWLIQVQNHLMMSQGTLHQAVAIMNHFLCRQTIHLNRLQLAGITSLLLAAKFNERFCPPIAVLVHLTDNTYTFNEVVKMEVKMLTVLKFQIHLPIATEYMDRFLRINACDDQRMANACAYLLDMTLLDLSNMDVAPSKRAAAVCCLMRKILDEESIKDPSIKLKTSTEEWLRSLRYYTSYSHKDLMPLMVKYAQMLSKAQKSKFQGARTKYASNKQFGKISHWSPLTESRLIKRLAAQS